MTAARSRLPPEVVPPPPPRDHRRRHELKERRADHDVFFALSVLFAAAAFGGHGVGRLIRALLLTSGVLALAGLCGVVTGDMRWRFIGIAGYAGVFPVATGLMAVLFLRAGTREG